MDCTLRFCEWCSACSAVATSPGSRPTFHEWVRPNGLKLMRAWVRSSSRPHLEHCGEVSSRQRNRVVAASIVQRGHEVHEGPWSAARRERPGDGGRHRTIVRGKRLQLRGDRRWTRRRRIGEGTAGGDTEVGEVASSEPVGERERDHELEVLRASGIGHGPHGEGCDPAVRRIGACERPWRILDLDDASRPFGRPASSLSDRVFDDVRARSQHQEEDHSGKGALHRRTVPP